MSASSNQAPLPLRDRLVEMRRALIEALAAAPLDGGSLALLSHVSGALAAIDDDDKLVQVAPVSNGASCTVSNAERAVAADDGRAINLALYTGSETVGAINLSPMRALQLGGDLVAAGLRRIALAAWSEPG